MARRRCLLALRPCGVGIERSAAMAISTSLVREVEVGESFCAVIVDAAKGGAAVVTTQRSASQKTDFRALLPPTLRAALSQKRKPKLQELATFTQQLSNLLHSGMPLTVALNSMTHLESKGISAEVSNAVIVSIICDRGDRYLSTGIFPA